MRWLGLSALALVVFACGTFIETGATDPDGPLDAGTGAPTDGGGRAEGGTDATDATNATDASVTPSGDAQPRPPLGVRQTAFGSVLEGTEIQPELAMPVNEGSLILVAIANRQSLGVDFAVSSVVDGRGNTYTETSFGSTADSCGCATAMWYATNARAGTQTVTVKVNGGATDVWIMEVTGFGLPLQVGSGLTGNATGSVLEAPPQAVVRDNTLITSAVCSCVPLNGFQDATGFTELLRQARTSAAYRITTEAGSYAPRWSIEDAGTYAGSTLSLIP